MAEPQIRRARSVRRPRRSRLLWVMGLAFAAVALGVLLGAYRLGQRSTLADPWDLVWLRAYLDRPIDTASPQDGFWVAGYYVDYDRTSLEMVKTRSNHMDQVVVFGYGFDASGNAVGQEHQIVKGLTGPEKRVLLFSNVTNAGFDKEIVHALLTDTTVRNQAVQSILAKTTELGATGVQIDFENIPSTDRDAYTAFLRELKAALQPSSRTLSVAVAAKTRDTRTGWGGATDYTAVGQIADQIYIMAYDEHWKGGEPGPIASLPWTENVIRYAIGTMPAKKIILGVPFYGYEWAADGQTGAKTNRSFGASQMATRVVEYKADVKWDPVAGENVATFQTQDGDRVAWFPDQRSLDAKLTLAYQYNLKGIALWRLGFEPDDWWNKLGEFRVHPAK